MFVPTTMRRRNYLLSPTCPANNDGGGDGGGDGGEGGGDGGGQGGSGGGNGAREYKAPATQEDFDELVKDRVKRAEKKGYDAASEKYKPGHDNNEKLQAELGSETDKAKAQAKAEAEAAERAKFGPRLVRQAFKAEAKGVLTGDQLDGLLEDLDLTKYLNDDGEVDETKVADKVKKIAPSGNGGGNGNGNGGGTRGLGQGRRQNADAKPGDAGRARAEKRFGKKSD